MPDAAHVGFPWNQVQPLVKPKDLSEVNLWDAYHLSNEKYNVFQIPL